MNCDIAIAGGGPGGLAAAESAARAGCSVVLLEQHSEIGSPTRTSGGSFIRDLAALGIPERLWHPIRRCRFLAPATSASFDYEVPLLCIIDVKGVFQFLAERAIDAGARLLLGVTALGPRMEDGRVTGVCARRAGAPEFPVSSKVVIDATGYRAVLLKAAGVHEGYQRFGVGAEYDLYAPRYDQSEALLIVGSQIAPSGYAWMFPWGRARVRVGVGIIHPDSAGQPQSYLDHLVANSGRFGADLGGAQPVEYHTGLIPSDGLAGKFVNPGILGVGDAAGQASALVGEGIRWAIEGGKMAGEAAAAFVTKGRLLSTYQKRWTRAFGTNLRIAYEINRKIAGWDDAQWNRGTELLKGFTPAQFGEALRSNFLAPWAIPLVMKSGLKALMRRSD